MDSGFPCKSNFESEFQSWAALRIPWVLDSTSKNFSDSGIWITIHWMTEETKLFITYLSTEGLKIINEYFYGKLMPSINLILGMHSLLLWNRQRREKNGVIISFYSKQFAPRSREFEIYSTYSGFFLQVFPSRNKVNRPSVYIY